MELGAKKALELPVSAPFHSSLLKPAGDRLRGELEKIQIFSFEKKVVSNVDGFVISDKSNLIQKLVDQVSNSVMWQQSIEYMIEDGVDTFIEIGPGKSLTGFAKRIGKSLKKDIKALSISDVDSFHNVLESISKGA